MSSYVEAPAGTHAVPTAYIGEVGLGGEIRPVASMNRRMAEAENMGFKRYAHVLRALRGLSLSCGTRASLCCSFEPSSLRNNDHGAVLTCDSGSHDQCARAGVFSLMLEARTWPARKCNCFELNP